MDKLGSFKELEEFLYPKLAQEEVVHITSVLKDQLLWEKADTLYEEHIYALISAHQFYNYGAVQVEGTVVEEMLMKFANREAYEQMYAPYKWNKMEKVPFEIHLDIELKTTVGYQHIGHRVYAKITEEETSTYRATIENGKVVVLKKEVSTLIPAMRKELARWMKWCAGRIKDGTWNTPSSFSPPYPGTAKIRDTSYFFKRDEETEKDGWSTKRQILI